METSDNPPLNEYLIVSEIVGNITNTSVTANGEDITKPVMRRVREYDRHDQDSTYLIPKTVGRRVQFPDLLVGQVREHRSFVDGSYFNYKIHRLETRLLIEE